MAEPVAARAALRSAGRVVVKVGTAVVTRPDGSLALGRLGHLVEQLHQLRVDGREVILVSSGAVGLGAERLGFAGRPEGVVDRQACAAAGQGALIALYDALFRRLGRVAAQVLLTEEDFLHRARYLNVHATLDRLLELGAVPIVNENDTVSTAELALGNHAVFGDNDRLSALVAAGTDADLLVMLSDVDGVYDAPPGDAGAARIGVWEEGTAVRIGALSNGGRGGMASKIAAARMASRVGCHAVVASGRDPEALLRVLRGDDVGTLFPARGTVSHRRRWLAYATAPSGRLVVNEGARAALVERNASLLPVGVVSVEGSFDAGAVVAVVTEAGQTIARGRCARSAAQAREAVGRAAEKPLVHRDQLVIVYGEEG